MRLPRFAWRHAPYALLAPLFMVIATAIHEAAHGLVGVLLGARVVEFHVWPGEHHGRNVWGWVQFDRAVEPAWLLGVAPALGWVVVAVVAAVGVPRVRPRPLAKVLFAIGSLVPIVDVTNQTTGMLRGAPDADHSIAFAGAHGLGLALGIAYALAVGALAWRPFCRVFGDDALSPAEFAAAVAGLALAVALAPYAVALAC